MAKNKRGIIEFIVEIHGDKAAQEYAKLEKQLQNLQKEQKQFNKGSEDYKKLQKEIDKTNTTLKTLNPTYEQLTKKKRALEKQLKRLTPGTEAFIKKSKEVDEVKDSWEKLRQKVRGVSKAQGKAAKATKQTGGALSRIKGMNPFKALLGPLGMLLGLVGGLIGLFTKSERGAKLLNQATGVFQATVSVLTGKVNDLTGFLIGAFEDPQQALKDFGQLLIDQIINRIKATISMIGSLGRALGDLVKGDFKGAKEAAGEAGDAFSRMLTGLDEEQQKNFNKELSNTVQEVKKQSKSFIKLAEAKRGAGVAAGQLAVQIQELVNEEERLNAIADANTLSFKQREEAAEKARQVSEQRAKKEIELAKAQLGLLSQEIGLRRRNGEDIVDLLQAQADARANVLAAEGALQQTLFTNDEVRRQLLQDRLERDLDIYIDGYDFRKTILEREFNDDKTSFERKKALQEEIINYGQESFDKQIGIIEQFAGQNVDVQELLKSAEDGTLQNKIRNLELSEIVEGRLLEIVKERSIAVQDFADLQSDLDKEEAERKEKKLEEARRSKDAEFEEKLANHDRDLELQLLLNEGIESEQLEHGQRMQDIELLKQQELLNTEMQFLERKKALLEQYGKDTTAIDHEIAKKKIAISENENAQKKASDERYQENKAKLNEIGKQIVDDSFQFFIDMLSKDEEARKKNAGIIKKFETAKVLVNLYREISEIWKNAGTLGPIAGPLVGVAQTALATGRAALGIRTINAQQFYRGGKVGAGNIKPLPSGDNVLATLQTGEVVLTIPQQVALGGAPAMAMAGVPGFREGGVVGQVANQVSVNPSASVAGAIGGMDVLVDEIKGLRADLNKQRAILKAYVVYDEFEMKKKEIEGARNGASF